MRFGLEKVACAVLVIAAASECFAQANTPVLPRVPQPALNMPQVAPGQTPPVIHIHHHHYYAPYGSYPRAAGLISDYSANTSFEYGFQPGLGNFYLPTRVNWGNLGFFGAFDPNSSHDGLWVLRVLPRSPADRFGLAVGDFIVKINGAPIESYRQLRAALDKVAKKDGVSTFTVWDPEKEKNVTLTANFGGGE